MYYRLDGDKVSRLTELTDIQPIEERRLAHTQINDVTVSTVFLTIDHGHGMSGTPILFETMVFGGVHDQLCVRYATYYEAMEGHYHIVRQVLGELPCD